MSKKGSAPGKIILCGEYAVVFGYPGIAVPAPYAFLVEFEEGPETKVLWKNLEPSAEWTEYIEDILKHCNARGTLSIETDLPLGKGMGTSTAAIVAIARCIFGDDCEDKAKEIEDALNPGHSGLDFAVIWNEHPVLFTKKDGTKLIDLPEDVLGDAVLIDTGSPNETTTELIAWMKEKEDEIQKELETIGSCAGRLEGKEDLRVIIRDHHHAQVQLGVVPLHVASFIAALEEKGGAAKVIGAGARTGGGGMVLALGVSRDFIDTLIQPDE